MSQCPDILCSQLYNQLSLNNSHNPEFAHSAPHSPTPNIVYQQSININSRVMVVDTNGKYSVEEKQLDFFYGFCIYQ